MSNKTLVAFLLDETGSMGICRDSTIEGFNEYIRGLREDKDSKYRFTLVKFDSQRGMTTVHSNAKIKNVPLLSSETYIPGGGTPLYDSIGHIVDDTEKSAHDRKVIVVIMTDGEENASREWDRKRISDLIEKKQSNGWAFMFLGANQDAWQSAGSIGIPMASAASYSQGDEVGTLRMAAFATTVYSKGSVAADDVLSRYTAADGTLKTDDPAS